MASQAQEYAKKIDLLIANATSLSPEAIREITAILVDTNRRLLGRIAELDPESYQSTKLQALLSDVDMAFDKFRIDATKKVNALQERAAIMATHDMSAAVGAGLGTSMSYGQLNPHTLKVALSYTADLISGLSAQASADVKGAIQRAFLGNQTLTQLIEDVGHSMGDGYFSGIFSGTGARAMRVAVNEVLRVHSIAGQARLETLAKANKKIKKQWKHILAAKVPRLTHIIADGQIVEVDEPFDVGGEQLMYPRDPKGRADNTIYCHCLNLPYIDDADLYATDDDRAVLKAAGLSLSFSS